MVPILKKIILSVLITFSTSAALAYFLTNFNISFLSSFVFFVCAQFVAFYFYNNNRNAKMRKLYLEKLSEQELAFEQTGMDVECAGCKKDVFAPIYVAAPQNFTCPHCGTENSIYLNIETAVVTRPV